jgi:hypothetical protein
VWVGVWGSIELLGAWKSPSPDALRASTSPRKRGEVNRVCGA